MPKFRTQITISARAAQALSELAKVGREFAGLGADARRGTAAIESSFSRARAGVTSMSEVLQRTRREFFQFFAAKFSLQGLRALSDIADRMTLVDARLRLATKSQEEFTAAQRGTLDIARRTGQPLTETVQLYARLADSMRALGGSQQATLALTETINQAIVVSGASASASAAGIQQLAQGFASGVLRGDEFNSVMENTPRVAKAIADGLNVPIGALRQMAEQGQLTADVVTRALAGQADAIAREFARMPLTIGRAFQNLRTEFEQFVGNTDKATGASRDLAAAVQFLADNLNELATALVTIGKALLLTFGGALLARAVTGVRALAAGIGAVNGALALFVGGAALSKLAKLGAGARGGLLGLALFGGLEVGIQIGEIDRVRNAIGRLFDRFGTGTKTVEELRAVLERVNQLIAATPAGSRGALEQQQRGLRALIAAREAARAGGQATGPRLGSLANLRRPGFQGGGLVTPTLDGEKRLKATEARAERERAAAEKRAAAAARALSAEQQRIETLGRAELERTKAHLDELQRVNEQAFEDRLTSIRAFYTQKTRLDEAAIDAEIATKRAEAGRAETGEARQALELEIATLAERRGRIQAEAAREAARAERDLRDTLEDVRLQLLELQGAATSADRRAAIERQYRDLIARAKAEKDRAGVEAIELIIKTEAAQAELAKFEQDFNAVLERMRTGRSGCGSSARPAS